MTTILAGVTVERRTSFRKHKGRSTYLNLRIRLADFRQA